MEKCVGKIEKKYSFFKKKQTYFRQKNTEKLCPKKGGMVLIETMCFFVYNGKSDWQNSQFLEKLVDKIGKIDYIVKNKTNRCGKI